MDSFKGTLDLTSKGAHFFKGSVWGLVFRV